MTLSDTKSAGIYHSPLWLRYAVPAVAVAVMLAVRTILPIEFEGRFPLLIFIVPVIVSALYGGPWPAMMAAALSVFVGVCFFNAPNLRPDTSEGATRIAMFLLISSLIAFVIAQLNQARHKAETQSALLQREIVERKKAETALAEAMAHAEQANNAKSEFLAHMSHEIRTPMNAVIGLTNILSISNPLTSKQRECVTTLSLSAESLLSLINDMLDIGKIEANLIELETIPFSLSRVAADVVEIISIKAREKALDFRLDASALTQTNFVGDPLRVRQILMNLCGNAIKFTASGAVTVILRTVATEADRDRVEIAVRDTGVGIPQDMQANIFGKFVQGDSSYTRKYGGSGLGLAITKNLTEMMGGTIALESTAGQGSVFAVTLPLHRAEQAAARPVMRAQAEKPTIVGDKILIVEDNRANVMVASLFLDQFGFTHDVAHDGAEALAKLDSGTYCAVLMDVQMQGMDGLEATRRIRERERQNGGARLPIIGMTAYAMLEDRERCRTAGMDDYLSKPVDMKELETKIKKLIHADGGNEDAAITRSGTA